MTAEPAPASPPDRGGQVTIVLDRKKVSVPRVAERDACWKAPGAPA